MYQVILRPVISEKTSLQKEIANQVTFEVHPNANKHEIKSAVEKIFNVSVLNVSTRNLKGKRKRRGRWMGQRKDRKRAVVRLNPTDRIEFFEGV
ncbi:MAG: 50S ribosomal protein L23 [Myxococcales bacterium]|nr:50S ribosomal protein L23 [Myxococcales bacterium]